MDSRDTVISPENFLDMLGSYLQHQSMVALLVDSDGLTRIEGKIHSLTFVGETTLDTKVTLDNGYSFFLHQMIAVNGKFRSDYSEC
ncbi:MAG: hypothetical protein ACM3VS_06850 [Candidatus Dadabacteria bacterium]